jgi:hypothetical protein
MRKGELRGGGESSSGGTKNWRIEGCCQQDELCNGNLLPPPPISGFGDDYSSGHWFVHGCFRVFGFFVYFVIK